MPIRWYMMPLNYQAKIKFITTNFLRHSILIEPTISFANFKNLSKIHIICKIFLDVIIRQVNNALN
jgi:hypothetical protein